VPAAPPLLGQHSDDILGELGYDAARIASLRAAGAI
jgi:crotonobetainyl-CoA:carnitine CoA-transferase CaiB-like acyl-CoA transferase